MCPFCIAAVAQVTMGAASAGGLGTLLASRSSVKTQVPRRLAAEKEKQKAESGKCQVVSC
jgi:hypothetical protein